MSPTVNPSDRRGAAIPMALFAIVVVGALVGVAFFAGVQEQRVAENSRRAQGALGVAEAGHSEIIRTWNTSNNRVKFYAQDSIAIPRVATPRATGSYGGYLYRFNNTLFLVDLTGSDTVSRARILPTGGARQRVGLLAKLKILETNTKGAVTVSGGGNIGGQGLVTGVDTATWADCGPTGPSLAGIRVPNAASVTAACPPAGSCVAGSPPTLADPAMDTTSANYYTIGGMTWAQLTASANISLPGGSYVVQPAINSLSKCDKTVTTNWGEPNTTVVANADCFSYFPTIYLGAASSINGLRGQGILLVNGDLTLTGGFQFYGLVIVKGLLEIPPPPGAGAQIYGAVKSSTSNIVESTPSGAPLTGSVHYSSCAITRALSYQAKILPLSSRRWAQLF